MAIPQVIASLLSGRSHPGRPQSRQHPCRCSLSGSKVMHTKNDQLRMRASLPGMEEKTTFRGASTGSASRPPWTVQLLSGCQVARDSEFPRLDCLRPSLACFSRARAVDLENRGSATSRLFRNRLRNMRNQPSSYSCLVVQHVHDLAEVLRRAHRNLPCRASFSSQNLTRLPHLISASLPHLVLHVHAVDGLHHPAALNASRFQS